MGSRDGILPRPDAARRDVAKVRSHCHHVLQNASRMMRRRALLRRFAHEHRMNRLLHGLRSPSAWTGAIALLLLALATRLVLSAVVPLLPEEAYYWLYSRHPDLSYFDHPPAVAWVI